MKRILALVEGHTEEAFVQRVLSPHLLALRILVVPVLIKTARPMGQPAFRGGHVSYASLRQQIQALCGDSGAALVTTVFDLYALAEDAPGLSRAPATPHERVLHVEQTIHRDVGRQNLRVYLQLHEFEALLFADIAKLGGAIPGTVAIPELQRVRAGFPSPEHIDDGRETCPSRRILAVEPAYSKRLDGPTTVSAIGLPKLRAECPHFRDWLSDLENLRPTPMPEPSPASRPSRGRR